MTKKSDADLSKLREKLESDLAQRMEEMEQQFSYKTETLRQEMLDKHEKVNKSGEKRGLEDRRFRGRKGLFKI